MNRQTKGNLLMLAVTCFWGLSYVFMKIGLDSLEPFTIITLRFLIAFFITALIFYKKMLQVDWPVLKSSLLLGSLLFLAFMFVTFGVKYTTVTKTGFLVSLTVLFVPLIHSVLVRSLPKRQIQVGLVLTFTGIFLLTLSGTSSFQLNIGDVLCILTALFYAIHIIVIGKVVKDHDPITLGVLQLGVTGGIALVFSIILETPSLPDSQESWIAILGLGIFCSAFGFIGQSVAQKYTTATLTSLIFSLEPVMAAFFAVILLNEIFTIKDFFGCLLVILGILVAQMSRQSLLKMKRFVSKI